jgi:predicted Zn-ribbon and HTH transcriptional regulator
MSLSLNELVTLVVTASLLLVAFASVVSRYLHLRAENRLVRMRTLCRICGHSFISDQSGKLCHCPLCDKPNLRRRNGRLG